MRDKSTLGSTVSNLRDRKSTRLNSSHSQISYAVFCLNKKKDRDAAADLHARAGVGSRLQGVVPPSSLLRLRDSEHARIRSVLADRIASLCRHARDLLR